MLGVLHRTHEEVQEPIHQNQGGCAKGDEGLCAPQLLVSPPKVRRVGLYHLWSLPPITALLGLQGLFA